MKITVPIYIESRKPGETSEARFRLHPLFFPQPEVTHERLSRGMDQLATRITQHLAETGRGHRQEAVAAWSFTSDLHSHRVRVEIALRKRNAKGRLLVVAWEALGRRVAFTPSLPELWFEVEPGRAVQEVATEVLTAHFRKEEKEADGARPEDVFLSGQALIQLLEVDVRGFPDPAKRARRRAQIAEGEVLDGASELNRVGRCLDRLYPDELQRAVCRERDLGELRRLLGGDEPRAVLLVGPRRVGKTCLVHAFVHALVSGRDRTYSSRENTWLIAPQRLISGMSYLGQWQGRLLAILRCARSRRHILYFDDLVGLFRAGRSANSSLSVAQVLKGHLERGELRVLAEITPEALAALQELDRGFVDLFHILRIDEPPEAENLRILIRLIQDLEARQHCGFEPDVLPAILDLTQRFFRDEAFPGKAAALLKQLASKHPERTISTALLREEFAARTGISTVMLDHAQRLAPEDIVAGLRRHVVGQDAAVEALADVVTLTKARLNDPAKPLGGLLFLGPTGVGKTQCARALAAYLFGSPERLLRFDLNEYGAPGSAARLVGTFGQPDGLLTGAIRRQPFAVVLFDEVEKADPGVFDVLLQVLGEGRLTDALGRTADLRNAVIIMTSNLGTAEAQRRLGLQHAAGVESTDAGVYVAAAERFFRPEFFNRIDRVVPFAPLGRAELQSICRRIMEEYFGREGLARRRSALFTDAELLDRLLDQAYDPQLGARPLKRAIERTLTRSIAGHLARISPATPSVITVLPTDADVWVSVQALAHAPQRELPRYVREAATLPAFVAAARAALARMGEAVAALRPADGWYAGEIRPEHEPYLEVQAGLSRVRGQVEHLARQTSRPAPPRQMGALRGRAPRGGGSRTSRRFDVDVREFWRSMFAAEDIHAYLREALPEEGESVTAQQDCTIDLVNQLSSLDYWCGEALGRPRSRVGVAFTGPPGRLPDVQRVLAAQFDAWCDWLESAETPASSGTLYGVAEGLGALVMQAEAGSHLVVMPDGGLVPFRLSACPIDAELTAAGFARAREAAWQAWKRSLPILPDGENPARFPDVVRVYAYMGKVIDLRTGWVSAPAGLGDPKGCDPRFRELLSSWALWSLPRVAELVELEEDLS